MFRGKSLSSVQLEKLRQLVSDHEEWFSSVLDPSESVVGTGSNGHTLDLVLATCRHIRDIIDGEVFRGKSLSSVQLEKLRQLVSDHEEWFSSVLDPSESVVGTGSNGHTLDYFNAKHRGLMEAYEDILRSPTRTEHSPPPHSDTRQEMTMSIPVVAGTVSSSAGHRPVAYPTGSLLIRDNELFTNDYNHNRTVPSETSILEGDLNQLDHQHHTPVDESFHQAIRSSQRSTSSRNEFSTGTRTITIIRARQGEESTTYTQTTQQNSIPRSLESQQVTPSELYDQVAFYERVIAERTYELFNIKYEVYASEAFDTSKLNSRLLRVHEEIKRFNETSQYTANLRHILMDAESDRRKYNRYRVDEVTDAIASVKNRLKSAVNVLNKHIAECRSWLKEKASTVSNGYEQVYRASREDLGEYQETINREYEILGDNFNVFLSMVRDSDQRSEAYPSERHRRPNTLPRVVLRESSNINQPMKCGLFLLYSPSKKVSVVESSREEAFEIFCINLVTVTSNWDRVYSGPDFRVTYRYKVNWKDHQNPGRSGLGSRKLGGRWQGPFVITDRQGNVYTVQDGRGSKRINGTQLRKWYDTPKVLPNIPAARSNLTVVPGNRWHIVRNPSTSDEVRYKPITNSVRTVDY
ncbi:hypothetical protein CLF_109285 [Clonorchis sinensis]|uniref:Uncharacterized protein n=1 Tax=Clonorchis sinensis TaxID=79923 RepID=G7YJ60_CLOSI|nr:hypothetical protein CLF_109285 [Clonorchis sinensis]